MEYWKCVIGPVDRTEVPWGGDLPLRDAVINRFIEMFGKEPVRCSSGWGLKQEMETRLSIISLLSYTDPSGEILKKIDEILKTRPM
jgi:hypothetical protein